MEPATDPRPALRSHLRSAARRAGAPTCVRRAAGDTVIAVADTSRLPLRVIVLSTVIALAAAVVTYALLSDDAEPPDGTVVLSPTDGTVDPDEATFETFDGEEVALASLEGTPVLVNFFASYCTPCIKEMPALEAVHQELGDQVSFLGLTAMLDRPADALDLVERTGVTYPTAHDHESAVSTALGVNVLPTTVLFDAAGEVVATHNGELDADELRQMIADELGIEA